MYSSFPHVQEALKFSKYEIISSVEHWLTCCLERSVVVYSNVNVRPLSVGL